MVVYENVMLAFHNTVLFHVVLQGNKHILYVSGDTLGRLVAQHHNACRITEQQQAKELLSR